MAQTDDDMPEGYSWEPSTSAFINHIGRVYQKRTTDADGTELVWSAIRLQDFHCNTWGFAHASLMASMADIGTSSPCNITQDAPVVIIDLTINFIGAPKLNEVMEVKGWVTKRTRSLVFAQARAESNGRLVFTAIAIHKVVGA